MSSQKHLIISLVPLERKADKPESEKFTHDQVGYEDPSTHVGETCSRCKHFIRPAACEGVQAPIEGRAWCHRFEKVELNIHKTPYRMAHKKL